MPACPKRRFTRRVLLWVLLPIVGLLGYWILCSVQQREPVNDARSSDHGIGYSNDRDQKEARNKTVYFLRRWKSIESWVARFRCRGVDPPRNPFRCGKASREGGAGAEVVRDRRSCDENAQAASSDVTEVDRLD
ncbi:MAG: hypothetical protein WD049_02400, partial [Candidatus Paceibacterota bacterium]